MSEIMLNLQSPAWWFTGVFFVVLFKLVPLLASKLKDGTKTFFKGMRLRRAKYIKENRHNLAAVNYQSIKSQAYFVVYILICSLYFIWFITGQLTQIMKASEVLFIVCLIPLVTFQLIWMSQNDNAKLLVAEYNKVRIKK
ncbi:MULTISPECIES: hypothetical protein [unclassified Aeromonas]|uniref:hypothetical protein n=1 Tax=unclassified Aeromonas TaxID=257493 RepID=UPI00084A8083|nr:MULTISPECIES: hypothetical protein [unclassified Aeromonas]OEC50243.1 hypothetical protein A9G04_15845 [Aeromonas sp. ANNP30]OEC62622.1 hypothetical protein A9G49_18415 [Aeromonas sp. ANP5]